MHSSEERSGKRVAPAAGRWQRDLKMTLCQLNQVRRSHDWIGPQQATGLPLP